MARKEVFQGETNTETAPILSALYFQRGVSLSGVISNRFETQNGICYTLKLDKKLKVAGEFLTPRAEGEQELTSVSIGTYKGLAQILSRGNFELKVGQHLDLECTGLVNTGKDNPMAAFKIKVTE
jgi:hypothetical protein